MSSISNDNRPLKRVIELAVEGIYPDNLLPSVLPSEAHSYSILDYNFIWVELLEFYFFYLKQQFQRHFLAVNLSFFFSLLTVEKF